MLKDMSAYFGAYIQLSDYYGFCQLNVNGWLSVLDFGVDPIRKLRTCVIKVVTFKGSHLMW